MSLLLGIHQYAWDGLHRFEDEEGKTLYHALNGQTVIATIEKSKDNNFKVIKRVNDFAKWEKAVSKCLKSIGMNSKSIIEYQ